MSICGYLRVQAGVIIIRQLQTILQRNFWHISQQVFRQADISTQAGRSSIVLGIVNRLRFSLCDTLRERG
jgi:hypothetical protein